MFSGNQEREKITFPGTGKFRQKLVYRSMGGGGVRHVGELLGIGFMRKLDRRCDSFELRMPSYVMVMIIRGSGRYVDGEGREYPLTAGMYFQRLPGVAHSVYIDTEHPWEECFLEVGEKLAAALESMDILKTSTPTGKTASATPALLDELWSYMFTLENAPESALPELVGSMIRLLNMVRDRSASDEDSSPMGRIIRQACRLLGSNFGEKIDLGHFCRTHGCGYENFRKQFRKEVGISPRQYRIRRRLDAAVSMLRERHDTIARIASLLGYSSPYEFSAQFRRKYGCSPSGFRGKTDGETQ